MNPLSLQDLLPAPEYEQQREQFRSQIIALKQRRRISVGPLITLGMASAFARFFFDHKAGAERDRTMGGIASLVLAFALGFGLLAEAAIDLLPGLGAGGRWFELTPLHLRLTLWICVATAVSELTALYLRAAEQAVRFAVFQFAQSLLYAGVTAALVLRGRDPLAGILVGQLAGQLFGAAATITLTLTTLRPHLSLRLLREAAAYSLPQQVLKHLLDISNLKHIGD